MNMGRGIIILALLSSAVYADNSTEVDRNFSTQSTQNEFNYYIDNTHRSISETVVEWADKIDTKISSWLGNREDNSTRVTPRVLDVSNTSLENQVKLADAFFSLAEQ